MIEPPEGLLWVVVEHSDVGDTTVGVFSRLSEARELVNELAGSRLDAYRIEGHALDEPRRETMPWQVVITRDGSIESTSAFIGCNCQDDEDEYYKRSFVEAGGERMYVIALATTPGLAIEAAHEYRTWLQTNGHWGEDYTPLSPIQGRTLIEPVASG